MKASENMGHSSEVNELQKKVLQKIEKGASLNRTYCIFNILATILACFGLIANNIAIIIGSMIIGVLLNPLLAGAFSAVTLNKSLFKKAIFSLLVGIIMIYATALCVGFLCGKVPKTEEIMNRTFPSIIDVIVACAGGIIGVYALVMPRLNLSLVGVAIATSLIPPLAASALLLVQQEYSLALGAFMLTAVNVGVIEIAAMVTFLYFKYTKKAPIFD